MTRRLILAIFSLFFLLPTASSPLWAQYQTGLTRYDLPPALLEGRLPQHREISGVTPADIAPGLQPVGGTVSVIIRLRTPPVASLAEGVASDWEELRLRIGKQQDAFLARWAEPVNSVKVLGRTRLVLNAVMGEVDASLVPQLRQDPAVRNVRRAQNYQLALSETVPYVGAPPLHDLGVDGAGIRVAVLDTGIDYTHANLGGPGTLSAYRDAYGTDPFDSRNTTSDGLFPTDKVVGGYDFLGELWPRGPVAPDPDPIDFNGHGTHVADIIGGRTGVAPGVELYALKVCAALGGGCSGLALIQAMEFAVDPNGDGDPSDHVDVVNMSLGADYGQPFDDDLSTAVDNATRLGVLTVAAAGNGGNRPYVTSTPAAAATAISVAQTQMPSAFIPTISLLQPPAAAGEYRAVFQPWSTPPEEPIEGPVQYGDGAGRNVNGCARFPTDSLKGKIVLVDRGACFFSDKIRHIQEAGGVLGFIAMVDGSSPFAGGFGGGGPITIPAYMISRVDGYQLRRPNAVVRVQPGQGFSLAGRMVDTSSRGPEYQSSRIKPEIGAPGASVSAEPGTGNGERGFGGTSGATPVITGVAALLLQGHTPGTLPEPEQTDLSQSRLWSPLEIKARLMNTAEANVRNIDDGDLAPISRIGAGEVRASRAFHAAVSAWVEDSPSAALSFGFIEVADPEVTRSKQVRVRNYSNRPFTFRVIPSLRYADDIVTGAVHLEVPNTITVPAGQDTVFPVGLRILGDRLRSSQMNSGAGGNDPNPLTLNEYDGFLTLDSQEQSIHLPWHVLPRQASRLEVAGAPAGSTSGLAGSLGQVPSINALELRNSGVGSAQNQAYSLLAVSPNAPRGGVGEQSPTPDLRAFGLQTFDVPGGFCSGSPSYVVAFAFTTWERQTHANWPGIFAINLDLDQDGIIDYLVFNTDAGFLQRIGQGRNSTWVLEVASGRASSWFFTEHATNSANTVLYLCAEQIGKPAKHQEIDASVMALDAYFGGPGDLISDLTFTTQGQSSMTEPLPDLSEGEEDYASVSGSDTLPLRPNSLGVLVFSNSDRGTLSRGGATEDTEALILLNPTDPDASGDRSRGRDNEAVPRLDRQKILPD